MPHPPVAAVIFDMDGVLTDSEPLINAAAVAMFRELGLEVRPEDFHPFVGTGENRYLGGVAAQYQFPVDLAAAKQRTYEIYLRLVPTQLRAFPGAVELVRACRKAGLKVAVASSADRIKIDANLNQIGLPPAEWDAVISAEDAEHKKPAPDLFLAAARRLGLPPAQCVVIEDAVNGIQAAKAAGMTCLAVAQTFPPDQLQQADAVHASVAALAVDQIAGVPPAPDRGGASGGRQPAPPPTPGPWGLGQTIAMSVAITGGFIAAQGVVGIALYLLAQSAHWEHLSTPEQLAGSGLYWGLATIASAPVEMGLIGLFVWLRRGYPVTEYLALRWVEGRVLFRWLLGLAFFLAASDGLTLLLDRPIVPPVIVEAYRTAVFPPVLWLALVGAAPLSEELFFRGFLFQGLLRTRLGGPGTIVVTALLWAAVHLQYDTYGMGIIFAGGLLFGWARFRTGSIFTPVLMHAVMNLVATVQVLFVQ